MHPALSRTDHRPWVLPRERWVWRQSWRDLLFAHWPVDARAVRHLVHPALEIHEFDGTSWIGVVPFRMTGVSRRPLPDIPGLSAFPELNLRLYVSHEGKPGVWFLSLDATNLLAVWAARRFFSLPYFQAHIEIERRATEFHYTCARRDVARPVRFRACYRPTSGVYESMPGTLEHFLTERYCLYTAGHEGRLVRVDVHHAPWPLQTAALEIDENLLLHPHGLHVDGPPTTLHFARRLDVVIWSPILVT